MRNILAIVLAFSPAASALALTSTTVSFQQNVNGYTGGTERLISEVAAGEKDGSVTVAYFVDGYRVDDPLTTTVNEMSPDAQDLLKFDGIIGAGAGQIPLNATILSATLQRTTHNTSNDQSGGQYGVAELNQPFTTTTSYFTDFPCTGCTVGSRGAWWEDGYAKRPTGVYSGMTTVSSKVSADITSIVQHWANGAANNGVVTQAGVPALTVDGWNVRTNANAFAADRPKLDVTYTTNTIATKTFQRDWNGYTGDVSAFVRSGNLVDYQQPDANPEKDDITWDGQSGVYKVSDNTTLTPANLTSFELGIDGVNLTAPGTATGSFDDFGLFKFNNVFGPGDGQSPSEKPVAKGYFVVTTGDNANARSPGLFELHAMQRAWDPTTLYTNVGSVPGFQQSDGDMGPAIANRQGALHGSEIWFDVTSYLENVRNHPNDDKGLLLRTASTDGWQILFSGDANAALRPRLVVLSDMSTAPVGVLGDYNNNGVVDAADYVVWRNNGPLLNEAVSPGNVDDADYTYWRSHFGATAGSGAGLGGGTSVPEPAALVLGLIAIFGMVSISNRNR